MRPLAHALVLAAAACNAINGVGDLNECGDACFGPDASAPAPDSGGDAASGPPDAAPAPDAPPPPCDGATCAPPVPPSCAGAPNVCGPNKDTSCCASAVVPPATFNRKNDPTLPATITAPFRLDVFEVTVGRFRAFVKAGFGTQASPPFVDSGANPKLAGSGWQQTFDAFLPATTAQLVTSLGGTNSTWSDTGNDTLPINMVSWPLAFAFCIWDGGRLPTDAEWNLAAAAGTEQRVFPWGAADPKTVDPSFAIYDCAFHPPSYACNSYTYCTVGATTPCDATACAAAGGTCATACNPSGCELADIAPVGSRSPKGDGKYGHADLSGSVAELVLDNDVNGDPKPCLDDCFSPMTTLGGNDKQSRPRVRGGSWSSTVVGELETTTNDQFDRLNFRNATTGFRCARDP